MSLPKEVASPVTSDVVNAAAAVSWVLAPQARQAPLRSNSHSRSRRGTDCGGQGRGQERPAVLRLTAEPRVSRPLQIRYWKAGDKEAAADRVRTAGLDTSARVTDLHPNTKYHVTVRAYNRAGTGHASPSANATTMKPRESAGPEWGTGVGGGRRGCL